MKNFELKNPTKIIFGENQISKLSENMPTGSKVLLLYGGGSIKRNGVYEQVINSLKEYSVTEFGGIPPNPEYEVLLNALKVIKEKKIDFLLAVGGGSVIDGTKFLSSAALFEGETPWDILSKRIRTTKGLPFGTVLTLPATGSEMNSGAVITRKDTKEKLGMGGEGLFPQFSILDPNVIKSLPKRQIANGIVDAFTHVLEQYMTYPIGAVLQDRFAESILQTLVEIAPKMLDEEFDYTTASNFMWSCTMALNGLIQKGVPTDWAIHSIGHELTALYGIDHARTLAIIMGSHYKVNIEDKKEKLCQFGRRIWGLEGEESVELALEAINKTTSFFNSLGIQTKLSEYTDNYVGTSKHISDTFKERGWLKLGERQKITPEIVQQIVEMSY